MTRMHPRVEANVRGTTGRTPDTGYPVAYPLASMCLPRFACSLDVWRPLEARTISRTSRSPTARVGGDGRERSREVDQQIVGGQRGGCLPVALINLPTSLPYTYISAAPTDELEGGGS
jgi:hypothetical protein